MSNTNSLSFPNMFDVSGQKVSVLEDTQSIVNRTRLLILTEPTELYMNPNFGVGLKKYLWQYNNKSVPPIIRDNIVNQLRLHEPSVIPDETDLVDGLMFSDSQGQYNNYADANRAKMTVALKTIFDDKPNIDLMRDDIYGEGWDTYLKGES